MKAVRWLPDARLVVVMSKSTFFPKDKGVYASKFLVGWLHKHGSKRQDFWGSCGNFIFSFPLPVPLPFSLALVCGVVKWCEWVVWWCVQIA